MSEIAYANQEAMYGILEDPVGDMKKPAVTDRMYSVGPVEFEQTQEFLPDEQIRATASRLPSIVGRMMPGEYNFDTYIKPSEVVATKPEHDVLFEALMGAGAAGGGGYQYTLEDELPSFTLWVKKGHTVFAFRGATVEGADFTISGSAIGLIGWSGKYMKQLLAGTCYTASIAGAVLTMRPKGAESFSEGMYVEVGDDDNSGAGFRILKNEPTANTLTLDAVPAPTGDANIQLVTPWWPASGSDEGVPVHGKLGIVTVGGKNCVLLEATVNMVNNIKYYIDEKNNLLTAEQYGRPKFREIDGNLNGYFIKRGASYYYRAEYQVNDALIIPCGKVAGSIMEIQIDKAEYRTPKISGDEEFKEDIPFIAVASSETANDEIRIVFK